MGSILSLFHRPQSTHRISPESSGLSTLSLFHFFVQGTFISVIKELYDAVSPDMPDDLTSTPVATKLPNNPPVMHFNYDEGHAGRLTVPYTDGGSIDIDWVLSQSHPREYIMSNLAYYAVGDQFHPDTELVIMSPGLNTVHQPREGELPSTVRMIHYTKILQRYPMAQIHTGSARDQPPIIADASRAPILRALAPKLPEAARPSELEGNRLQWAPDVMDAMQVALSYAGHWDPPLKLSFVKMLETTKLDGASPFVLVVYSRASVECDAALRKHVRESRDSGESGDAIEKRLRERVTILTVGSASSSFVDGPKYLHLAAWNDSLSSGMGVTAGNNAKDAGKDAVFLNCDTPWHPDAFDNHNFSSSTSQFLALVMAASKASGFADLWIKARNGELVTPEGVNELVNAMIVVTNGAEYLWKPEDAWKNVDKRVFPDRDAAVDLLRIKMGEEFKERLLKNFPGK